MTAREEFNHMLNASANPRAAYGALMGFALAIAKQKLDNPREALLAAVKEGEAEHE